MYHKPVLLEQSIDFLNINPEGIYIDLTFGGGGHSKLILEKLNEKGKLFAFDQDEDAKTQAEKINALNFFFIESNFRFFQKYLRLYGVKKVDGILADLGVSSHQLDEGSRGFSGRFEARLDMRMQQNQDFDAKKLINQYNEKDLQHVFSKYGELRNAKTLAQAIIRNRLQKPIESTYDLKEILNQYAPKKKENKYLAQVFQAIRIEVNDELNALKEMLMSTLEALKVTGRLVVLSYHSLEDRLVKNFLQKGKFEGELEKDIYGNVPKPFKLITRKPLQADINEISQNSRSRSVKLRVGEKLEK